jgi:glucose-6-phosphate isomerase
MLPIRHLQLLRDGPDDKVTLFLKVDELGDEVKIPSPQGTTAMAAFRLLQGHSLQELLTIEYHAIAQVLAKRGRPNLTFSLDRLDERAMGALYFALCSLTAFTGTLWGVNPFDQPGVEEGKVYIQEALGGALGGALDRPCGG